jgi:hypothetical protein
MKTYKKKNHFDNASAGIVLFATAIGLVIRLAPTLSPDFPLNDGGLFYIMIQDLQKNHYTLPAFTTYNMANIPFAYPPLAFYIAILLANLFHQSILNILRVVPPVISAMSIPIFFLLAKEVLNSKAQTAVAVLALALTPRAFAWSIMGGGITRACGFLFALLTLHQAYKLYTTHVPKYALGVLISGTLVVLTHPEAAVHTVFSAFLFFLCKDRSLKGFIYTLAIAIGVILFTSPWWGGVIARHGLAPFLAVIRAAESSNFFIRPAALFGFLVSGEPFLAIIACIGLIGLFTCLAKRTYFLPVWLAAVYLFEPRGGPLYMMLPLSMAVGIGLDEVILPALRNHKNDTPPSWVQKLTDGGVVKIFLAYLLVYSLISAYSMGLNIALHSTLQRPDLEAMEWVKANTPENGKFILITREEALRDPSSEWFPALAERKSLATVFGYEWTADHPFERSISQYEALQNCAYRDTTCLETWAQQTRLAFTYVYIRKINDAGASQIPLSVYLAISPDYELVYESDEIAIFHRKASG